MGAEEIAANVDAVVQLGTKMREVGADLKNLADQLDDLWSTDLMPPNMQQGSMSVKNSLTRMIASLVKRAGFFEDQAGVLDQLVTYLEDGDEQAATDFAGIGVDIDDSKQSYDSTAVA